MQVVEEKAGWYKGYLVSAKKKGIFPVSYIELLESKSAAEARSGFLTHLFSFWNSSFTWSVTLRRVAGREGELDPLVNEVIDVLREWSLELKKYASGPVLLIDDFSLTLFSCD